jgi:hypothetical protein
MYLQLPLERTGPQQLHIIDFGIAGKIDARGAAQGQNPCAPLFASFCFSHCSQLPRRDGTPLYAHAGAALRAPVTFRDDLEALGYTLLALASGSLPWETLAMAGLPKKAQDKRTRDVAALKRSTLPAALAAVAPAPLGSALRDYFAALKLDKAADNTARFDYAALRAPFCAAYAQLSGGAYSARTLDMAPASAGAKGKKAAAEKAPAGRKRAAPAAESPAPALEFESTKRLRAAGTPTRKSPRRL